MTFDEMDRCIKRLQTVQRMVAQLRAEDAANDNEETQS
jgi:exonuclease VII small subunit